MAKTSMKHRSFCQLYRLELAQQGRLKTERYDCICEVRAIQRDQELDKKLAGRGA